MNTFLKFPITVTLESYEIMMAVQSGFYRMSKVIEDERGETHGSSVSGAWGRHAEGALGECAMAKCLGMYWPGPGQIFGPNIPTKMQVCTTEHDRGRLIIHENGSDADIYWLLTGARGTYCVRGWILGSEGKQKRFWTDPQTGRPAYFIPQSELNEDYVPEEFREMDDTILSWQKSSEEWEKRSKRWKDIALKLGYVKEKTPASLPGS